MHSAPEISIIIPASGTATALRDAIASIGDTPRAEILVVTERHAPAVPDDPRVVVLRSQGHGANMARNLGLALARAPLVAFLNPADRWLPGKLDAQLRLHAARPDTALSFTDHRIIGSVGDDHGSALGMAGSFARRHAGRSLPFALGETALAQIFAEDLIGISTVVAGTALLRDTGGFDARLSAAAPWDAWLRLSALTQVACLPQVLAEQRLPPRARAEAPARLAALREVARRHRCAALSQDAAAVRHCAARLLVGEAGHGLPVM